MGQTNIQFQVEVMEISARILNSIRGQPRGGQLK
jgi:hypothetical protein